MPYTTTVNPFTIFMNSHLVCIYIYVLYIYIYMYAYLFVTAGLGVRAWRLNGLRAQGLRAYKA